MEAIDRVDELVDPVSDFTAIHLDLNECVPWSQMIADEPLPDWLAESFAAQAARIPSEQFTYVSVTPTAQNRVDVAAQCGESEGEKLPLPAAIADAGFDDPVLVAAFNRYIDEVVAAFSPKYLLIGIEMTELSRERPAVWPQFEKLYFAAYDHVKSTQPDVSAGPGLVIQSLLLDRVADQVKPVTEKADFLGMSFYPYAAPIAAAGGVPLPVEPPQQWREPLEFLRGYTDTPIAIAETGYATRNFRLDTVGIDIIGSEKLQEQFLTDLANEAAREDFLFIVWFVPVDYPALTEALKPSGQALDLFKIWEYAGLWRPDTSAKPALEVWKQARDSGDE